MKNIRSIFKSLSVVAAVFVIAATMSSCDKDENTTSVQDPAKSVPDPAGTITVNISENSGIDFFDDFNPHLINYIYWCKPDNFDMVANHFNSMNSTAFFDKMSICNLGKMNGLGNIKSIPQSGFTKPARENSSVACEVGHGYVVKIEPDENFAPIYTYARLYVVEAIVSTSGGIMGAKIKYQYPFVP